jgi:hypothetical protein
VTRGVDHQCHDMRPPIWTVCQVCKAKPHSLRLTQVRSEWLGGPAYFPYPTLLWGRRHLVWQRARRYLRSTCEDVI